MYNTFVRSPLEGKEPKWYRNEGVDMI